MKTVTVLSSVTYALKAQEILKKNGIYAEITRSRAVRSVRGCGYGVSYDPKFARYASELLAREGVPSLGTVEDG